MKKPHVTVSIPYFQCKPFIRRSVESILSQTYSQLTLVVANDGDEDPPWDVLSDIDDPRLIRFDLHENHGPYFVNAVVLEATGDPYLLIQDADDWSDLERVSLLLEAMREHHAVAAFSAEIRKFTSEKEFAVPQIKRFTGLTESLTYRYEFRANNTGLFKTEALRNVGGYYGGFRIAYDTLLMNFLLMTGPIAYLDEPLYHRIIHPESLTQSRMTGLHSEERRNVNQQLEKLYSEAFDLYCEYLAAKLELATFTQLIRQIRNRQVSTSDQRELLNEAKRLQSLLQHNESGRYTANMATSGNEGDELTKVSQKANAPKEGKRSQASIHDNNIAISIVIPARNELDLLVNTIHSIHSTRSTNTPIEIVVVDDASDDGCCSNLENEIEMLGTEGLELKVLRLDRQRGVYQARNLGAQQAQGEILFMTDAHMRFIFGWDREVLENIQEDRILAATVTDSVTGSKGYGCLLNVPLMGTSWNTAPSSSSAAIQIAPCSGTILYTDLFRQIGGYDTGMLLYGSGEPEFSVRAWLHGKEILLLSGLEVQHRFKSKEERQRFLNEHAILRLHNRIRFGLLYLDDEMSRQMLEYFTRTYPEQAYAALQLIDKSDVWIHKESLEQSLVLDFAWFMKRFEM